VLDPMTSLDDREAQDIDLVMPPHANADLCLRGDHEHAAASP
jgi:hypothetical protein